MKALNIKYKEGFNIEENTRLYAINSNINDKIGLLLEHKKLNEKISENSFIGYGGKYKFTFAKVNNDYVYTSTSYINS